MPIVELDPEEKPILLSADLHRLLEVLVSKRGTKLKQLTAEILRAYLKTNRS